MSRALFDIVIRWHRRRIAHFIASATPTISLFSSFNDIIYTGAGHRLRRPALLRTSEI